MPTAQLIAELIAAGPVLLDGAWGTEMQARGLGPGETPDFWNLEHPDRVEDVARRYKASEDPEHLMYVERSEEGEGTCSRSAQTAENKIPLPKMFADHTRSEIRFYGLFVGMGH